MNGRIIVATAVGAASGSRAAAAALVCAASEPDRPGLLVDVGGRPPRPTLVASSGARELEERLTVHLPQLRAASRGGTCHLAVPAEAEALDRIAAALPLVREAAAVLHVPPALFQDVLRVVGAEISAILLRADLAHDRGLTALAVRELRERPLSIRVLKRPLAWVPARRALFGVLPADAPGALPPRLRRALIEGAGVSAGLQRPSLGAVLGHISPESPHADRRSHRPDRGDRQGLHLLARADAGGGPGDRHGPPAV